MLTQERLKEFFIYDEKTGFFTPKYDRPGSRNKKGIPIIGTGENKYMTLGFDGDAYLCHRLAWLYVEGYLSENMIDHKDQIKNHNWFDNLREASKQCNINNTGNWSTNTSGIKGVYFFKRDNNWRALVMVNGKNIHLGYFQTILEAAKARAEAEKKYGFITCNRKSPAMEYVESHC